MLYQGLSVLGRLSITPNKYFFTNRKKFTYISPRNAGTRHDSVCYNYSNLKLHMEEIHNPRSPKYLVSDEGVNCQKTVLTAYRRDRGEI